MILWKLGCRWGSNTPLFYDFIKEKKIVVGWIEKEYNVNDWILVADGHTILAFAKVLEKPVSCLNYPDLKESFEKLQIPYNDELIVAKAEWIELKTEDRFSYELQQGICRVQQQNIKKKFHNLLNKYTMDFSQQSLIDLLVSKKQIILQGPPGTGKTRLAKQLAKSLTETNSVELSSNEIKNVLKIGVQIPNASGVQNYYTIKDISDSNVTLTSDRATQDWVPSFAQIQVKFKQLVNGEEPENKNGLHPYELAVAKYLYKTLDVHLKKNNNYQLIQFHPSYSYEDFVRGITAKSNGISIEYKTENKILAKLAETANNNFINSKKSTENYSKDKWFKEQFSLFCVYVQQIIDEQNHYELTKHVAIVDVNETSFGYIGHVWANQIPQRMRFIDIQIMFFNDITNNQQILQNNDVSGSAKQHATYYLKVLNDFKNNITEQMPNEFIEENTNKLENFVLIIDEINRANLPAVLGELIYALEYRGEKVESMYDIEGDNSIIIPPNLYIIGTMNTADRSVGHIDYAIRRRFAFVDVLPDASVIENERAKALFEEISSLFQSNDTLASDFKPAQVQLGHSYFIVNDDAELQLKAKYEIVPILEEYLKDGILLEKAEKIISELKQRFDN